MVGEQLPAQPRQTQRDVHARRDDLRTRLWQERVVLEAHVYVRWTRLRHRLGLHTFVEQILWDIEADYRQYRGWRCMVCDEALDP